MTPTARRFRLAFIALFVLAFAALRVSGAFAAFDGALSFVLAAAAAALASAATVLLAAPLIARLGR